MKRKMTNSIALGLTVLLAVMTFVPTAQGQQPRRKPVADSGVLTPAVGQTLRVTVAPGFRIQDVSVVLGWMQYGAQGCSGIPAVCRHMVASQGSSPVQMLGADDALSLDVPGNGNGMRVIVFSSDANVRVLFQILGPGGEVVAVRNNDGDPIAQF